MLHFVSHVQGPQGLDEKLTDFANQQLVAQIGANSKDLVITTMGAPSEDQRLLGRAGIHLTKWGQSIFAVRLASPGGELETRNEVVVRW